MINRRNNAKFSQRNQRNKRRIIGLCNKLPNDLQDRRVEITDPVDRK